MISRISLAGTYVHKEVYKTGSLRKQSKEKRCQDECVGRELTASASFAGEVEIERRMRVETLEPEGWRVLLGLISLSYKQ